MAPGNKNRRRLIICCAVTAILILALIVTAVILYFTILKPKQPKIITQAVALDYIRWVPLTYHLNVSLSITVAINNPNYGSFAYENSTAHVTYRGDEVAEAPILADTIPARGEHDVSTTVLVVGDKMLSNSHFITDVESNGLNFTSSTTLHGVARVWKIIKVKASTFSTCNISVFLFPQNATAVCSSKIKY